MTSRMKNMKQVLSSSFEGNAEGMIQQSSTVHLNIFVYLTFTLTFHYLVVAATPATAAASPATINPAREPMIRPFFASCLAG